MNLLPPGTSVNTEPSPARTNNISCRSEEGLPQVLRRPLFLCTHTLGIHERSASMLKPCGAGESKTRPLALSGGRPVLGGNGRRPFWRVGGSDRRLGKSLTRWPNVGFDSTRQLSPSPQIPVGTESGASPALRADGVFFRGGPALQLPRFADKRGEHSPANHCLWSIKADVRPAADPRMGGKPYFFSVAPAFLNSTRERIRSW